MIYRSFLGIKVREEIMDGIPRSILKKYDTFRVLQVIQCYQKSVVGKKQRGEKHGPVHKKL